MSSFLSPEVRINEIDLTGFTQATRGGLPGYTVSPFQWGPAEKPILVSDTTFERYFGPPNASIVQEWHSARNFLFYSGRLYVSRMISNTAKNAVALAEKTVEVQEPVLDGEGNPVLDGEGNPAFTPVTQTIPTEGILIENIEKFETITEGVSSLPVTETGHFVARYPGAFGNGLIVSAADASTFDDWEYSFYFDSKPGTSEYAQERGGINDEMHVIIIDGSGNFTGTPGTILERYAFVSKALDTRSEGQNTYYLQAINNASAYVYCLAPFEGYGVEAPEVAFTDLPEYKVTLAGGADNFSSLGDEDYMRNFAHYLSAEDINGVIMFTGIASKTVFQYCLDKVVDRRRDCVVVHTPPFTLTRGQHQADAIVNYVVSPTGINRSSSYGILSDNWKMIFDRYTGKTIWLPTNSDVAGCIARVGNTREPWFSPGGVEAGKIVNCMRLAWNPDKNDRDTLYKNGINSIINIRGQGPVLFGDRTMLRKASAFRQIHVRILFIYLRMDLGEVAAKMLFRLNDAITRANFRNLTEPYLRDIQGRRGLTEYRVICDETNNPPEVRVRQEFVGTVMVKPINSINFVTLNLVGVREGMEFDEIENLNVET